MTDSEFPPPQSHASRRRIGTTDHRLRRRCPLADATGIGCGIVRRPLRPTASGRRCPTCRTTATTVSSESII